MSKKTSTSRQDAAQSGADGESAFLGDDFGQKIDLTVRIREILRNYPEGTSIFKELIQNADDAKAKSVSFCLDCRTFSRQEGSESGVREYGNIQQFNESPSLLVHNDAVFTEQDFASIQSIGNSMKQQDSSRHRTGRFGIGFNSVFHLTEVPSFVSDKFVVMFDPHAKYLPDPNPSNPGKRIDFIKHRQLQEKYPSVFKPLRVFGCSFKKPYKGTIFRFPLRTAEQAAKSKLTQSHHSAASIAQMLAEFQREAHTALLFLKHVEHIVLFSWENNSQKQPRRCFRASIINMPESVRKKRALQWASSTTTQSSSDNAVDPTGVTCDFKLDILSEHSASICSTTISESSASSSSVSSASWVRSFAVFNNFGGAKARKFLAAHQNAGLNLMPWGGCAALIHCSAKNADLLSLDPPIPPCTASCTLPLPIVTGLPVQVNGFFELSSNRRDVWHGSDLIGVGAIRCEWNELLLVNAVTSSYLRFAQYCRSLFDTAQLSTTGVTTVAADCETNNNILKAASSPLQFNLYSFFPTAASVRGSPWTLVVHEFYRQLYNDCHKLFFVKRGPPENQSIEWVDVSNAIFACADTAEEMVVADILSGCSGGPFRAPVCVVPRGVLDTMMQHCQKPSKNGSQETEIQLMTPKIVRTLLKSVASTLHPQSLVLSQAHFKTLSAYCLSDLRVKGDFLELVGVPILAVRLCEVDCCRQTPSTSIATSEIIAVPLMSSHSAAASHQSPSCYSVVAWTPSQRKFAHQLLSMGFQNWAFISSMSLRFANVIQKDMAGAVAQAVDAATSFSLWTRELSFKSDVYLHHSARVCENETPPISVYIDVAGEEGDPIRASVEPILAQHVHNLLLCREAYRPTAFTALHTLWKQHISGHEQGKGLAAHTNINVLSPAAFAAILHCILGFHENDVPQFKLVDRKWLASLWDFFGHRHFAMQLLHGIPLVPVEDPCAGACKPESSASQKVCAAALCPLDQSSIADLGNLSRPLARALRAAGVLSYCTNCVTVNTPDDDHQFQSRRNKLPAQMAYTVQSSSAVGAFWALLNLAKKPQQRQSAGGSLYDLIAQLNDSQDKSALFRLTREAFALQRSLIGTRGRTVPPLFVRYASQLRKLPIFPHFTPNSEDVVYRALDGLHSKVSVGAFVGGSDQPNAQCCLEVELVPGTAPSRLLAVPHPLGSFDQELLEKVLKVQVISFPEACVTAILPGAHNLLPKFAVAAARQTLASLGQDAAMWRSNPKAISFLRRHPFIPVGSPTSALTPSSGHDVDSDDCEVKVGADGAGTAIERTPTIQLACAADLYENQSDPLYTNNVGESFRIEDILPPQLFPHPTITSENCFKVALRQLGIRTRLQRRDILYVAKNMTSPSQAANLLAYLDSQFERYFIDSSTAKISRRFARGLAKLFGSGSPGTKAESGVTDLESTTSSDLDASRFQKELTEIPWLPAMDFTEGCRSETPFLFPWESSSGVEAANSSDDDQAQHCGRRIALKLCRPLEVRLATDAWLCSLVHPILAVPAPPSRPLCDALGLRTPLPTKTVALQLTSLAQRVNHAVKTRPLHATELRLLAKNMSSLYYAIDHGVSSGTRGSDALRSVAELLRKDCWVWSGTCFVKSSQVAQTFAFDLPPVLFRLPAEVGAFPALIAAAGVADAFDSKTLLSGLQKIANQHEFGNEDHSDDVALATNPSPLPDELLPRVVSVVAMIANASGQSGGIIAVASDARLPVYCPDVHGILRETKFLVYDDMPWLKEAHTENTDGFGNSAIDSVVAKRRVHADNLSIAISEMVQHVDSASSRNPSIQAKFQVHSEISHDIAQRIGVQSLRRLVLGGHIGDPLSSVGSDSEDQGSSIQSFGQHEPLTGRLSKILEAYPDGTQVLHELIQNADDAGATRVRIVLDENNYGERRLFSSAMREFQGPALYCFNDAEFRPEDFVNLATIGQGKKLEEVGKTGRFGLGFNSVYHFTDIPSFVSGDHIVFLDPHASHIPYATAGQPGVRINFGGDFDGSIATQFSDQFAPYQSLLQSTFAIDSTTDYCEAPGVEEIIQLKADNGGSSSKENYRRLNGTVFRFPLRQTPSEISTRVATVRSVVQLLSQFEASVHEALLFLKNVRSIEVFFKPAAGDSTDSNRNPQPHSRAETSDLILLYSANCPELTKKSRKWRTIDDFIRKFKKKPMQKTATTLGSTKVLCRGCGETLCRCFYNELEKLPPRSLPGSVIDATFTIRRTHYLQRLRCACAETTAPIVSAALSERKSCSTHEFAALPKFECHEYVIASFLGGGKAREIACANRNFHLRLVPRASVAFRVARSCGSTTTCLKDAEANGTSDPLNKRTLESSPSVDGQHDVRLRGKAFVTLPLPIETGLPCHVNARFELTSNRRNLWNGLHGELAGDGAVRCEWNDALMEDVVAPTYAWLLLQLKKRLGWSELFLMSWPRRQALADPSWQLMLKNLYQRLETTRILKVGQVPTPFFSQLESCTITPQAEATGGGGVAGGNTSNLHENEFADPQATNWISLKDAFVVPQSLSSCSQSFKEIPDLGTCTQFFAAKWKFVDPRSALQWLKDFLFELGLLVLIPGDLQVTLVACKSVVHAEPSQIRRHSEALYARMSQLHPDNSVHFSENVARLLEYALLDVPTHSADTSLGTEATRSQFLAAIQSLLVPIVAGPPHRLGAHRSRIGLVSHETPETDIFVLSASVSTPRVALSSLMDAVVIHCATKQTSRANTMPLHVPLLSYHLLGPTAVHVLHGVCRNVDFAISEIGADKIQQMLITLLGAAATTVPAMEPALAASSRTENENSMTCFRSKDTFALPRAVLAVFWRFIFQVLGTNSSSAVVGDGLPSALEVFAGLPIIPVFSSSSPIVAAERSGGNIVRTTLFQKDGFVGLSLHRTFFQHLLQTQHEEAGTRGILSCLQADWVDTGVLHDFFVEFEQGVPVSSSGSKRLVNGAGLSSLKFDTIIDFFSKQGLFCPLTLSGFATYLHTLDSAACNRVRQCLAQMPESDRAKFATQLVSGGGTNVIQPAVGSRGMELVASLPIFPLIWSRTALSTESENGTELVVETTDDDATTDFGLRCGPLSPGTTWLLPPRVPPAYVAIFAPSGTALTRDEVRGSSRRPIEAQWIHPSARRMEEGLTISFGIREMPETKFWREVVLPVIETLDTKAASTVMAFFLSEYSRLKKLDTQLPTLLTSVKFVPARQITGHVLHDHASETPRFAPRDLCDPSAQEILSLQLTRPGPLLAAECFPTQPFDSVENLEILRKLGLQTKVSLRFLFRTARSLATLSSQPELNPKMLAKLVSCSKAVFNYISVHFKSLKTEDESMLLRLRKVPWIALQCDPHFSAESSHSQPSFLWQAICDDDESNSVTNKLLYLPISGPSVCDLSKNIHGVFCSLDTRTHLLNSRKSVMSSEGVGTPSKRSNEDKSAGGTVDQGGAMPTEKKASAIKVGVHPVRFVAPDSIRPRTLETWCSSAFYIVNDVAQTPPLPTTGSSRKTRVSPSRFQSRRLHTFFGWDGDPSTVSARTIQYQICSIAFRYHALLQHAGSVDEEVRFGNFSFSADFHPEQAGVSVASLHNFADSRMADLLIPLYECLWNATSSNRSDSAVEIEEVALADSQLRVSTTEIDKKLLTSRKNSEASPSTHLAKTAVLEKELLSEPWIWCGALVGFKKISSVAFNVDTKLEPYLCGIPSFLSKFESLWTHVGVRQVFRVSDLVHRLNSLPTHRQLRHKELDFAVKLLCEIAEKADPELELPNLGIRHLPTRDRRLLAPQALFANDAQWIVQKDSSSNETVEPNIIHMDVPSAFIQGLEIKSVRERILSGTQAARQLECPNARDVAQFNNRRYGTPYRSSGTNDRDSNGCPSNCLGFVLDDVLRTLDRSSLRANWVRVHVDERSFPREKLVHTSLAEFQGPAICIHFGTTLSGPAALASILSLLQVPHANGSHDDTHVGYNDASLLPCFEICDCLQVLCGSNFAVFHPLQKSARLINFVECSVDFGDQYAPFEEALFDHQQAFSSGSAGYARSTASPLHNRKPLVGSVVVRLPIRSYPSQLSRRFFPRTKNSASPSTSAGSRGTVGCEKGTMAVEPLFSFMGSILTHTLDAFRNILTFSNHVEAVAVSCVAATARNAKDCDTGHACRPSDANAAPTVLRRLFGSARLVNAAEVREAKLKVANSKKWRQSSWVFWKKTSPATNSYPLHIEFQGVLSTYLQTLRSSAGCVDPVNLDRRGGCVCRCTDLHLLQNGNLCRVFDDDPTRGIPPSGDGGYVRKIFNWRPHEVKETWLVYNRMAPQRLKDLIFSFSYQRLRDHDGLTPFVAAALLLDSTLPKKLCQVSSCDCRLQEINDEFTATAGAAVTNEKRGMCTSPIVCECSDKFHALAVRGRLFVNGGAGGITGLPIHIHANLLLKPVSRCPELPPPDVVVPASIGNASGGTTLAKLLDEALASSSSQSSVQPYAVVDAAWNACALRCLLEEVYYPLLSEAAARRFELLPRTAEVSLASFYSFMPDRRRLINPSFATLYSASELPSQLRQSKFFLCRLPSGLHGDEDSTSTATQALSGGGGVDDDALYSFCGAQDGYRCTTGNNQNAEVIWTFMSNFVPMLVAPDWFIASLSSDSGMGQTEGNAAASARPSTEGSSGLFGDLNGPLQPQHVRRCLIQAAKSEVSSRAPNKKRQQLQKSGASAATSAVDGKLILRALRAGGPRLAAAIIEYCVETAAHVNELSDVPLICLGNGTQVCLNRHLQQRDPHIPLLLLDCDEQYRLLQDIDDSLFVAKGECAMALRKLERRLPEALRSMHILPFSSNALALLFPHILPSSWRNQESVEVRAGNDGSGSCTDGGGSVLAVGSNAQKAAATEAMRSLQQRIRAQNLRRTRNEIKGPANGDSVKNVSAFVPSLAWILRMWRCLPMREGSQQFPQWPLIPVEYGSGHGLAHDRNPPTCVLVSCRWFPHRILSFLPEPLGTAIAETSGKVCMAPSSPCEMAMSAWWANAEIVELRRILCDRLRIPRLHRCLSSVVAETQRTPNAEGSPNSTRANPLMATPKALLTLLLSVSSRQLMSLEFEEMKVLREALAPGLADAIVAQGTTKTNKWIGFSAQDLQRLSRLPIFLTVSGNFVALVPQGKCITLPEDDGTGRGSLGSVLPGIFQKFGCHGNHTTGRKVNHRFDPRVGQVCERLLVPDDPFTARYVRTGVVTVVPLSRLFYQLIKKSPFSKLPRAVRQACCRDLVSTWSPAGLREDESLRDLLSNRIAIIETSKADGSTSLRLPRELLDHEHELLCAVFENEPQRFAPLELQQLGPSAHQFLADLGMQTSIDKALCLQCAQKIADFAEPSSGKNDPLGLVADHRQFLLARRLLRHVWDNLDRFFSREFFRRLAQVRCVPVEVSPELAQSVGLCDSTQLLAGTGAAHIKSTGRFSSVRASSNQRRQLLLTRCGWVCTFARFKDCAAPSCFKLLWSVVPVLGELDYPAPSVAAQLGIAVSAAPSDVLCHLQNLVAANCLRHGYQWPEATPMLDVFNAIFGYFAEQSRSAVETVSLKKSLPDKVRHAFETLPLIPIAGSFVKAAKVFLRCDASFMPILWEIPRHFGSHQRFFAAVGCKERPLPHDLVNALSSLNAVKTRSDGQVETLNVNELTAAASILATLSNSPEAYVTAHLGHGLRVPDIEGVLVPLPQVVYSDDSTLAALVDGQRVRLVNPLVSWQVCSRLGISRLSDIVERRIDPVCLGSDSEALRMSCTQLSTNLRSPEFAEALHCLLRFEALQDHASNTGSISRPKSSSALHLSPSKTHCRSIVVNLQRYEFRGVQHLRSIMSVDGVDVTLSHAPDLDISGGGGSRNRIARPRDEMFLADVEHAVLYLCSNHGVRNIARENNSGERHVLTNIAALALQSILPSGLHFRNIMVVSALLDSPPDHMELVLETYGILRDPTNALAVDYARGRVGSKLHPLDRGSMQLDPGRIFLEHELVAWEDEKNTYRYGRVISQSFEEGLSLGLSMLTVEVLKISGTGNTDRPSSRRFLSSNVWTFESMSTRSLLSGTVTRRGAPSPGAAEAANAQSAVSSKSAAIAEQQNQLATDRASALHAVQGLLSRVGIGVDQNGLSLLKGQLTLTNEVETKDRDLKSMQTALKAAQEENVKLRQSFQCSICMENEVDRILVPCGHLICKECVHQLRTRSCPFDRKQISQVAPFYKPF